MTSAFPIQRQIHADACVAASACSLASWLGQVPPGQALLDAHIQAGMRRQMSGFDALCESWAKLKLPGCFVRDAPAAADLPQWVLDHAQGGLLVAHDVLDSGRKVGVHITVVFREGEDLLRADPGDQTVTTVTDSQLRTDYAGDVAFFEVTVHPVVLSVGSVRANAVA